MLGYIIGAHLVYTPGLLKLAQPLPLSTRRIYIVWCSPLFVDVMLYVMPWMAKYEQSMAFHQDPEDKWPSQVLTC